MDHSDLISIEFIDDGYLETRSQGGPVAMRQASGGIAFVVSGSGKVSVKLHDYHIAENDIIMVMQGNIFHLEQWSLDFRAYYITFSSKLVSDADLWKNIMESLPVMIENPVLSVGKSSSADLINSYCAMIYEIYSKQDLTFRIEIIKNMLEAVMFAINGLYIDKFKAGGSEKTEYKKIGRNEEVYKKFLELVSVNYTNERSISFYANELCITPKHLAYVVKTASGSLPTDIISHMVIMDAKGKLKSTNMSVSQISESLNFPDNSFFCKYFRKHVGMTPKKYRDSVK